MKKFNIGIAIILFSFVSSMSFAASTAASKKDVTIPCYNGGFSFGLAGYDFECSNNASDLSPSVDSSGLNQVQDTQSGSQTVYE